MTINSVTGKPLAATTLKSTAKVEVDTAKITASTAEKIDSIAITAIAKEIHRAFESSSASSAIDFDRVAAVKKALADGSYTINAEKVAEKLIQFEKLMPQDNST
ncbi:MAG: flagellar biosynthesis anti-sigma factor FlgM [Methylococcaceae bacterium]|nr:flagellar biosynthesis anti-sigma factor FlgM [Methylococcaceae bacterium]